MTTPVITPSTRYFLPGTTKVLVVPVVADLAVGPTRIELNASTDVSDEIASITGWAISSDMQAAPDLGKRFVPQVNGRLTASDSGLTFWADKTGTDVRALLTIDQDTNVVFLDGGDVAGSPMCVYTVKVNAVTRLREIEGLGRIETKFTISAYNEDLVAPAAV